MNNMKIALFHPWIKSRGGAERVVLEFLKNSSHKVDLYTWVFDEENTFEEFKNFNIKVIAPNFMKRFSRSFISRGFISLFGLFSKINLKDYDVFFVSTSGIAEIITLRNHKKGGTFAYVHTILRDSYKDIVSWNLKYRQKNIFKKIFYLFSVLNYRIIEKISWKNIDGAIFNSHLSLSRAKNHRLLKGKQTYITHPPIDLEKFKKVKTRKDNYFIYISRFNIPKRQDVLVEAWKKFVEETGNKENYKLILIGNKENERFFNKVKNLSKGVKSIEIKTNLSDEELLNYYSGCLASIFVPFMEDFGIVPIESLAMGKPLLAVDNGGYIELVEEYKGFFPIKEKFDRGLMVEEISKSIKDFLKRDFGKINRKTFNDLSSKKFTQKIEDIFKN